MATETHTSKTLTLELSDDTDAVTVLWLGKSTAREPSQFVLPVLRKGLDQSTEQGKTLVLDFRKLEYLNSSTITPIIRLLEEAKRGTCSVTVLYEKDLRWQDLSFSALEIFCTDDKRIQIRGM